MSDCIFEIPQLWQSGFSRVYSNSCCRCLFEREIIKIGQSSHKMYSNNILNFQVSTTILNACTEKKSGNLLKVPLIYMDISYNILYNILWYISYNIKTITDADYADDIALLANTPNQAETLLHSLERAAAGIGLHVNAHKTEYMCYNQTSNITTLDRASLKLVDKFTYLGSSVSSTEKDIDTRLAKAWTAIDRLSIIWKSDLTDKMKRRFFQAAVVSILLYGCTTWTLTKRLISDEW